MHSKIKVAKASWEKGHAEPPELPEIYHIGQSEYMCARYIGAAVARQEIFSANGG